MSNILAFVNGYVCLGGKLYERPLYIDVESGCILDIPDLNVDSVVDLHGQIVAPAFLELQTNGCAGFHFTHLEDVETYQQNLAKVSRYLVTTGVGSFWATIPTVSPAVFKMILPHLKPREFRNGADLLGAHCEGPWLNPAKKGAHDATLMQLPEKTQVEEIYGAANVKSSIKMVTLAPELEGSTHIIKSLTEEYGVTVSLGHSAADFETGFEALKSGAKSLTHVFNAMAPLGHRLPGLAGLFGTAHGPYYSIIPDGIHLHPAVVSMAFRANPEKCILITDSIEMAGMPDGLYPGHAQIPHMQRKLGNRVTIDGTETLIGSCVGLDECVRNLWLFSGCSLAEAVRCVTENVAGLMGLQDRGVIAKGRRADLVVLDQNGYIQGVWSRGRQVFDKQEQ